jgi:hypothetical protein
MKSIFVALLLGVSVVTTFCLTYAGAQGLGQAPAVVAPSSDSGSYWKRFPVSELPISTPPPVVNFGVSDGDIPLVLPSDCKNIIGVSNGRSGIILCYRNAKGEVKAAQYQNPQAGVGPDFTYIFVSPNKA